VTGNHELDGERLAAVISALRSGAAPDVAWQAWGTEWRRDDSLGKSLVAADSLARRTGAPLADILEGVAAAHRTWEDAAERRDAALAGPRASARTLMWLPAVGVALGALIEPATLSLLFTTVLGWALLLVSAALVWAAHRWMRALVARAVLAGAPL
jgi:tight adherence protein B